MEEQLSLFSEIYDTYKITKPIKLIELFGGIGAQAKAQPCSLHRRDLRKHLDKLYKQLAKLIRRNENIYN